MNTDLKASRRSVLFVDISGSTELFGRAGDAGGRRIVSDCLSLLRIVITEFGGVVIDQIGDELMTKFDTATDALSAAVSMQIRVGDLRFEEYGIELVQLRIGLHLGPVIEGDGGVHGDSVHTAKRMVDLAKPGQIITTENVVDAAGADGVAGFEFRLVDITRIKGKQERLAIHEVIWDPRDLTVQATKHLAGMEADGELVLTYKGIDTLVGAERPSLTIGRSLECGLVVRSGDASRLHARVEMRRWQFVVCDLSTNGTVVTEDGGRERFVMRDELRLEGSGSLDLGSRHSGCEDSVVRYRIVRGREEKEPTEAIPG